MSDEDLKAVEEILNMDSEQLKYNKTKIYDYVQSKSEDELLNQNSEDDDDDNEIDEEIEPEYQRVQFEEPTELKTESKSNKRTSEELIKGLDEEDASSKYQKTDKSPTIFTYEPTALSDFDIHLLQSDGNSAIFKVHKIILMLPGNSDFLLSAITDGLKDDPLYNTLTINSITNLSEKQGKGFFDCLYDAFKKRINIHVAEMLPIARYMLSTVVQEVCEKILFLIDQEPLFDKLAPTVTERLVIAYEYKFTSLKQKMLKEFSSPGIFLKQKRSTHSGEIFDDVITRLTSEQIYEFFKHVGENAHVVAKDACRSCCQGGSSLPLTQNHSRCWVSMFHGSFGH